MTPETEHIIKVLRTAMRVLGYKYQDVEAKLGVAPGYIGRLFRGVMQQRRESGQVTAKTTRARTPIWQSWADWLTAQIQARPDIYLRELQANLKRERGVEVSLMTICNACRALRMSSRVGAAATAASKTQRRSALRPSRM